jgi:hypothetical protein
MKDLIAKLEAATEGSRELDAEINGALFGKRLARPVDVAGGPPQYTTSLDAALSLVPEGYAFSVTDGARNRANVWKLSPIKEIPPPYSKGATPALALVIAALRARSAP